MVALTPEIIRSRLAETGIGFAGVDGHWWRPAREPFILPVEVSRQLDEITPALFQFFDVLLDLYQSNASQQLTHLLEYKVPENIPRLVSNQLLLSLRPDFQLCPRKETNSSFQLVLTELEVCPSAHGFAHAMQSAYGQATDLVDGFATFLNGRDLLFAGSQSWSEFIFEQLAFCRALAGKGIRARVLYDLPLSTIAAEVSRRKRWQPPLFGIPAITDAWDADVLSRIRRHRLEPYLWPGDATWPETISNTLVFRFGYFDCFPTSRLLQFLAWEATGARFINPLTFFFESKVVMAALRLPEVREHLDDSALIVLDRCIPETILLTPENRSRLLEGHKAWVLKYAAYDGGNQAWGGHSLEFGKHHSHNSWTTILDKYLALPWPVVAQRLVPTARFDLGYLDEDDNEQVLTGGFSRLRVFFLRDRQTSGAMLPGTLACGAHVTVSSGQGRVSEGLESIQAPVIFS